MHISSFQYMSFNFKVYDLSTVLQLYIFLICDLILKLVI